MTATATKTPTAVEAAREVLARERAAVTEWVEKLRTLAATGEQLDNATARIDGLSPDKLEAEADRIAAERTRLAGQRELAERALANAQGRVREAQKAVLAAHAEVEDAAAEAARKELAGHTAKVAALLSELHDLDGATYAPQQLRDPVTNSFMSSRVKTRADAMKSRVLLYEVRAATVRYYLATGKRALFEHELRLTGLDRGLRRGEQLAGERRPAYLYGPDTDLLPGVGEED